MCLLRGFGEASSAIGHGPNLEAISEAPRASKHSFARYFALTLPTWSYTEPPNWCLSRHCIQVTLSPTSMVAVNTTQSSSPKLSARAVWSSNSSRKLMIGFE